MMIKDTLQRDPATHPLVNAGQARIVDTTDEKTFLELRGELSTFVCEGQYAEGVQKIIRSFLDGLAKTNQRCAWVSGFFGSGKSHLLKMLCHLWQDTEFPDGALARNLIPAMPEDLRALLRELDTAGKRAGGLVAAAGSMLSGPTDHVRLTILGILLRALGLPSQYPLARFCLWLRAHGHYDAVRKSVEASGKEFDAELNDLYVSPLIARAMLACDPNFASDEMEARKALRAQFPPQTSDVATEDFLRVAKEALKLRGRDGRMPCTLLILDEVQQYIGQSNERSVIVSEVAEAVAKQLDSHVVIVGAGQSALTEAPLLHRLMDRFTIRVPLSDSEVETVTRKVLLHKKPTAVNAVRKLLETHAGEVSRQLQGTRIGEAVEDREVIVEDYPVLPVRRRFWEHCFRQIDAAGTHSQLRSQLCIIHDAVAKISSRPLGAVVSADELFDALAPEMVNTGVLLREINERIVGLGKDGSPPGRLAQRICGLVFLIGKLKHEGEADIGVRATREHIADLLVDDLAADNGKLRAEVEIVLKKLADRGVLMQVGDEFRLQTKEGQAWDQEFRNRQTKLNSDDGAVQFQSDQLIYAAADAVVRSIRISQGAAREARHFVVHREQTPPQAHGGAIPVWIRDGWSCAEKEVLDAARGAGSDSATIFVFIPRHSAEDLRRLVVEAEAAQKTLETRGNPTTTEGQDARQGMESRRAKAAGERDLLVKEVVANAKVFQGGGSEVLSPSLDAKLRTAADDALVRLFPRFKDADSSAWGAAVKRARDGADHPFQPTGHDDATEKHPVCRQVLASIGSGRTGTEIRKELQASPFGWPRDAIDAALIALHRSQNVMATLNGAPVPAGQLDQNRIPKAEFRVEQVTVSVSDKIALRGLFGKLGIHCKAGEEAAKAPEFLAALIDCARSAGGDAPLPPPPSTSRIEDIRQLVGNEQLAAIRDASTEFDAHIKTWSAQGRLAGERKPAWDTVERLARHATGLAAAADHRAQIDAIRSQRLLLAPMDALPPIRSAIAGLLREAVNGLHAAHTAAHAEAVATLAANETWRGLPAADQKSTLADIGLELPVKPNVSTDEALLAELDARSFTVRRTEIDAIPGRMQEAIRRAAERMEPKVRTMVLERATLRSEDEVGLWLERQRAKLLDAVRQGPVLIG